MSLIQELMIAFRQMLSEDSEEEIIFETDRELVVTTAQLQAVLVREPSRDMYSDHTLVAKGQKEALVATEQKDEAFLAFSGDRSIPHSLYVTCPNIFDLPELEELNLIIIGDPDRVQKLQDKLNWYYWDGSQWKKIENPSYKNDKFTYDRDFDYQVTVAEGQRCRGAEERVQINFSPAPLLLCSSAS